MTLIITIILSRLRSCDFTLIVLFSLKCSRREKYNHQCFKTQLNKYRLVVNYTASVSANKLFEKDEVNVLMYLLKKIPYKEKKKF